jgi:RNA polymerase sigma factor (sigma-70 family)
VREVVRTLDDPDRLLLQLIYEQELDATGVAKILGLTPSGVRMRKQRLLAKLVEKLRDLAP